MNMIRCSNNCLYQKDGSCTLDKPTVSTTPKTDCCYFVPASDNNIKKESAKQET